MTHKGLVSCRYQGIGIRIEDEVLITATGYEVLVTLEAPK
jgi:Xaa-Pro aminopeptidase